MNISFPLTIESIRDEDEEQCRIISPAEIASILRDIAKTGTNAALYYNPKRDFIMTTVLDLDEDGLWVEQGHDTVVNRHIAESRKITLVAAHNHVKTQFTVTAASSVDYDGKPAFFLAMPGHIYRLQRRDGFRLMLPHADELHCIVQIEFAEERGDAISAEPLKMTVKSIDVPASDISTGGIGLTYEQNEIELESGETYSNCRISLPGQGEIQVSLTVRDITDLGREKSGKIYKHAGCELIGLDRQATFMLQRFIMEKQRMLVAHSLTA